MKNAMTSQSKMLATMVPVADTAVIFVFAKLDVFLLEVEGLSCSTLISQYLWKGWQQNDSDFILDRFDEYRCMSGTNASLFRHVVV